MLIVSKPSVPDQHGHAITQKRLKCYNKVIKILSIVRCQLAINNCYSFYIIAELSTVKIKSAVKIVLVGCLIAFDMH